MIQKKSINVLTVQCDINIECALGSWTLKSTLSVPKNLVFTAPSPGKNLWKLAVKSAPFRKNLQETSQ